MPKNNRKLRILEVTAFSAGICGVWTRVFAESKLLAAKGHNLQVFSSNIFRGGAKGMIARPVETLEGVKIQRFPAKYSFGENTFFWDFEKEALKFKPDIIIAHAYRQYYSTKALKIAKKLGIPCFLVTHAPFLDKKLRSWKLNLAVFLYDSLIGRRIINQYTKVLAITRWEIPYLLNIGCRKDKIILVPNGIPQEFFKKKSSIYSGKNITSIFFFGRIAPIKDMETLIRAIKLIKKKIVLNLIGPVEPSYKSRLENLIKNLKIENLVKFYPPVYNLSRKIEVIDNQDIFILPSKREAMPQALIEVMARKKIVISSNTEGGKEIIHDGKNGFLFEIGNENHLAEKINFALESKSLSKIKQNALNSVRQFSWDNLIKKIENIYLKK